MTFVAVLQNHLNWAFTPPHVFLISLANIFGTVCFFLPQDRLQMSAAAARARNGTGGPRISCPNDCIQFTGNTHGTPALTEQFRRYSEADGKVMYKGRLNYLYYYDEGMLYNGRWVVGSDDNANYGHAWNDNNDACPEDAGRGWNLWIDGKWQVEPGLFLMACPSSAVLAKLFLSQASVIVCTSLLYFIHL